MRIRLDHPTSPADFVWLDDGICEVTRPSPLTRQPHSMLLDITVEQLHAWVNGELIQRAFPNLAPHEREFLQTGYTQADWDAMWGPEE
jgi:hypothetical protein